MALPGRCRQSVGDRRRREEVADHVAAPVRGRWWRPLGGQPAVCGGEPLAGLGRRLCLDPPLPLVGGRRRVAPVEPLCGAGRAVGPLRAAGEAPPLRLPGSGREGRWPGGALPLGSGCRRGGAVAPCRGAGWFSCSPPGRHSAGLAVRRFPPVRRVDGGEWAASPSVGSGCGEDGPEGLPRRRLLVAERASRRVGGPAWGCG